MCSQNVPLTPTLMSTMCGYVIAIHQCEINMWVGN